MVHLMFTRGSQAGASRLVPWESRHALTGFHLTTTRKGSDMTWLIALILAAAIAFVAGAALGGLALLTMAWLMLVLRPVEAGALVADLTRRRFR